MRRWNARKRTLRAKADLVEAGDASVNDPDIGGVVVGGHLIHSAHTGELRLCKQSTYKGKRQPASGRHRSRYSGPCWGTRACCSAGGRLRSKAHARNAAIEMHDMDKTCNEGLTAQRRDTGGVGALVDVHLAVLVVTQHLDVHCADNDSATILTRKSGCAHCSGTRSACAS